MSQEPFYAIIYRKKTAAQSRGADVVGACAVEMHGHVTGAILCENSGNAGEQMEHPDQAPAITGLYTYRKNPSVRIPCLEKKVWTCVLMQHITCQNGGKILCSHPCHNVCCANVAPNLLPAWSIC